jgi:hypothetical protein
MGFGFHSFDYFGTDIKFSLNGMGKYKSNVGALFTLCYFGSLIYITILNFQIYFSKGNFQVTT